MRALIMRVASARPIRTAAALASTNYVSQFVRTVSAIMLRMVLPAADVGVVGLVQIASATYAAFTSGLVYRAMRDIPNQAAEIQRTNAARDTLALGFEAVLAALPYAAILVLILPKGSVGVIGFLSIVAYSIFFRLISALENSLSSMRMFSRLNTCRLLRALDGPFGLLLAWHFQSLSAYLAGAAIVGLAAFIYVIAPFEWHTSALKNTKLFRHGGSYGALVALDKIFGVIAQQVDGLVVFFLTGPASLAGYYLGVNVRGVLLQIAIATFWVKWADAVREYDKSGRDTYTTVRLIGALGAGILLLQLVLTAVLGGVTALLIPSYFHHMPEIAVASGVAIPFSLSQGLRSRHFLTGTVSLLPMLSALRIGVFALACFAISQVTNGHHLGPLGIAWGAFIAATLECTVYSAFNARAVSKPRLFWATFSICVLAAITNVGLAWAFIKLG